jgi:hypothetical protein
MTSHWLFLNTGYCTNVHAGRSLPEIVDNLRIHAFRVQSLLDRPIGIGLWFSENALQSLLNLDQVHTFQSQLSENLLIPYTLNGFPQGDFHQAIVKHNVYLPTWWEESRARYTLGLIDLLDRLLPPNLSGSISTLPIAWGNPIPTDEQLDQACDHLIGIATRLSELASRSNRTIVIALEPEPGCYLTDSRSFREFYLNHLIPRCQSEEQRASVFQHITLCHDVCHAAVMFEDQARELQATIDAGIKIGKVQISSAISIPWGEMSNEQQAAAWRELQAFSEDRYLHQTCIHDGTKTWLMEDLPIAMREYPHAPKQHREWRVHFHVPIYLESFGALRSTQPEIDRCLNILKPLAGRDAFPTGHFEVETYAWTVLPPELRVPELAQGIADEIRWLTTRDTERNT